MVVEIKLLHGDCLELMKEIPDKSIDMILCDLPYGVTACKWDTVIPFEPLWKQYNRIIKDNGAICLFGQEPFTSKLINSNLNGYKHKWIWNKKISGSFLNAKYMPLQICEDIIIFTSNGKKVNYYPIMKKGKLRKKGGCKKEIEHFKGHISEHIKENDEYYPINIIEIYNPRLNRLHPTQKPVALLEYLIKTYTNADELVLDNCMGSGSTGIACINTNRRFIGIEKDDNYFNVASERINKHLRQREEVVKDTSLKKELDNE